MIVVTAPTSKIGSQILENLITKQVKVKVIARNPGKLAPEVRQAVEVVQGSHSDSEVVTKAFNGADTLFWLVPADPQAKDAHAAYVDFAKPGCEAMRQQGVKRVVAISALGRGWQKDAGHVTATLEMDDDIAATGVSLRALTCASFMDNIARQSELIKAKGVFYGVTPRDLKAPTCATRDIAQLATSFLLDTSWTGVEEVPVLGPEDLSFDEMAGIISEVIGKPVRYEEMPMKAFEEMLAGRMSPGMVRAMVNMMVAKNEGLDTMVSRSTAPSTTTTFRVWCDTVLKSALEVGA